MLIDQATIFVRSGKGGDGCMSFRREKYIPKGGPDGGNGGHGGSVFLVGDPSLSTLLPLTPRPHYRAEHGRQGLGKSMHGRDAEDLLVPVPLGTIVRDRDSGEWLGEMRASGERLLVASGGKGGRGNESYKSATHQTPREWTPGEPSVELALHLELKLIADVGLVGLPNAGKSTMLRATTRGRPKVADYPFTTLSPHLGIAELPGEDHRRLVVADIPGLIEGAADGAGLGHDFLRHVERTSVLLHVVDVAPLDGSDPVENYETIRQELVAYSAVLGEKPEVVVLNKVDLLLAEEREEAIRTIRRGLRLDPEVPMILASGATGEGTAEMLESCWTELDRSSPEGWTDA
ncbi:MAG: GTPase ObgE [Phycisphaerales bacterium]